MVLLSDARRGELQIVSCTICFAVGFSFQRWAELHTLVTPCSYSACRNIISSLMMLLLRKRLIRATTLSNVTQDTQPLSTELLNSKSNLWSYGLICGLCNTFGSALQQYGLVSVSAGKVAFITSLYMIAIPFCECNIQSRTYVAATVALVGVYLLSGCAESELCIGGSLGIGEFATLGSVFFWTISIMASDKAAADPEVNEINLTTIEFSSSALLGLVLAWFVEPESFAYPWIAARQAAIPIVAVGITEALGFTLCILGQRFVAVSRTALLLSLEGGLTAFAGYLALGERLTLVELFGAALLFFATTLTTAEEQQEQDGQETDALKTNSNSGYHSLVSILEMPNHHRPWVSSPVSAHKP